MTTTTHIELTLNGGARAVEVAPHHTLLEVLRDDLGLTGTKECCLVGECGACTVRLDGLIVDSCLVLAVEADGGSVTTVEGLAADGRLHPLQQAFLDTGAVQCGFCIPGQLDGGGRPAAPTPAPDARRDRGGPRRQPVPLRLLLPDHRGGRQRPPGPRARPGRAMIGTASAPSPRVGGVDRASPAQQAYVADIHLPDELHVKLVTVAVAHARIVAIDATRRAGRARRPARLDRRRPARSRCRASGRSSRPAGHRRRRDASTTASRSRRSRPRRKDAAEEAAALVRVDYEELPAVVTIAGALGARRAARPGPVAAPRRPAGRHATSCASTRSAGATSTRRGRRRPGRRGHLPLPDGHPVRHRAARVHGRARRRRHRDLELDPAPVLAAAGHGRRRSACRWPRCASSRPTRVARSAASSTPSTSRCVAFMALATGRPVRLVLTLEETFQAVRRGGDRDPRPDRRPTRRHASSSRTSTPTT